MYVCIYIHTYTRICYINLNKIYTYIKIYIHIHINIYYL